MLIQKYSQSHYKEDFFIIITKQGQWQLITCVFLNPNANYFNLLVFCISFLPRAKNVLNQHTLWQPKYISIVDISNKMHYCPEIVDIFFIVSFSDAKFMRHTWLCFMKYMLHSLKNVFLTLLNFNFTYFLFLFLSVIDPRNSNEMKSYIFPRQVVIKLCI